MKTFNQEFHTLNYVIKEADNILLFAHSHPDSDTIGSVFALKEYIGSLGKNVDAACLDPLPEFISELSDDVFNFPAHLDLKKYKLIIACDAVERGFEKIRNQFSDSQVVAIVDHHPYVTMRADISILDTEYSSVAEILYDFFQFNKIEVNKKMASLLLLGILADTGMFQHSNTSTKIMKVASELMKCGANLSKLSSLIFDNKKICTLKLWGKALEKAKINPKNGLISSILTLKDIEECQAGTEDVARVSQILNTVPGTKFSLILSEREGGIIKGSLRSEEGRGMDVAQIATSLGGGGHKLAAGFEIKGKIKETEEGWKIE
jgi:bifunctional oligoribonuclease and PAP phosphatase NrnA